MHLSAMSESSSESSDDLESDVEDHVSRSSGDHVDRMFSGNAPVDARSAKELQREEDAMHCP